MSGFEVIGVILGATPLIISALEGYQRLDKKRDAFKRKSLHIDNMVRALRWQHILVHSDVKIVLRNAGFDQMMIDQHVGIGRYEDLLKRQDVQDAVSSFLGDNCAAYMSIIQKCESTLLRVAKAIKGFEEESWIANGSLAGMMYANQQINRPDSDFWKRVKFSMRKDNLESSINEIDKLSRLLERLREKSQQDHQVMVQLSSSSAKKAVSMLRKVQVGALELYRALAQSWKQSCQDPHGARLYLDYRIDVFEARKIRNKQENIEFSITLQSCPKPSYHTCVVQVLNFGDSEHFNNARKPTVSFKTTSNAVATAERFDIDNMCSVLDRCKSSNQSFKLYLVENERLCYEHTPSNISGCRFNHVHGDKMISLQDLLQNSIKKRTLQLKPRVRLAAIMASSALQLHTTPWCKNFRNESFLFAQDGNGKIDLQNPFVACSFDDKQALSITSPPQAESELLDLGILILELWHNETMEKFAHDSGLILEDFFESRQSIARKWIAETQNDLLTSIYDAAVRCVNCRFDIVDVDLTNHQLNVSIFDGVVKPLWENCRN